MCGPDNPSGLRAEFLNAEREDGERVLLTRVNPKPIHQSYPNRMHGGVISAILDESIGRSVDLIEPDAWAVTAELNVKFRKPVPLDKTLYVESKITNFNRRVFDGEGKMFADYGVILASASGRFFRVPINSLFSEGLHEGIWIKPTDPLPEIIEI